MREMTFRDAPADAMKKGGSPDWARTSNSLINSSVREPREHRQDREQF